jgi:hypothetical protein
MVRCTIIVDEKLGLSETEGRRDLWIKLRSNSASRFGDSTKKSDGYESNIKHPVHRLVSLEIL